MNSQNMLCNTFGYLGLPNMAIPNNPFFTLPGTKALQTNLPHSSLHQQNSNNTVNLIDEDISIINKNDLPSNNDVIFNDHAGLTMQSNPFNVWDIIAKNTMLAQTAGINQLNQPSINPSSINPSARNIHSILELQMNILDQKKIMNEVFHLMLTNNLISSKISGLTTEKNQLLMKISVLEGRNFELPRSKYNFLRPTSGGSGLSSLDASGKLKRQRRLATQIDRHYRCPIQNCMKSYGSEGSLFQHIKIKHPNFNINSISGLGTLNRMKTQKQLYAKIEEFLNPLFRQPHLQNKFGNGMGIAGLPMMGMDMLNELKNKQRQSSFSLNNIVK